MRIYLIESDLKSSRHFDRTTFYYVWSYRDNRALNHPPNARMRGPLGFCEQHSPKAVGLSFLVGSINRPDGALLRIVSEFFPNESLEARSLQETRLIYKRL